MEIQKTQTIIQGDDPTYYGLGFELKNSSSSSQKEMADLIHSILGEEYYPELEEILSLNHRSWAPNIDKSEAMIYRVSLQVDYTEAD